MMNNQQALRGIFNNPQQNRQTGFNIGGQQQQQRGFGGFAGNFGQQQNRGGFAPQQQQPQQQGGGFFAQGNRPNLGGGGFQTPNVVQPFRANTGFNIGGQGVGFGGFQNQQQRPGVVGGGFNLQQQPLQQQLQPLNQNAQVFQMPAAAAPTASHLTPQQQQELQLHKSILSHMGGTGFPKFNANDPLLVERDGSGQQSSNLLYNSVGCMEAFKDKSLDELRFEDKQSNRYGPGTEANALAKAQQINQQIQSGALPQMAPSANVPGGLMGAGGGAGGLVVGAAPSLLNQGGARGLNLLGGSNIGVGGNVGVFGFGAGGGGKFNFGSTATTGATSALAPAFKGFGQPQQAATSFLNGGAKPFSLNTGGATAPAFNLLGQQQAKPGGILGGGGFNFNKSPSTPGNVLGGGFNFNRTVSGSPGTATTTASPSLLGGGSFFNKTATGTGGFSNLFQQRTTSSPIQQFSLFGQQQQGTLMQNAANLTAPMSTINGTLSLSNGAARDQVVEYNTASYNTAALNSMKDMFTKTAVSAGMDNAQVEEIFRTASLAQNTDKDSSSSSTAASANAQYASVREAMSNIAAELEKPVDAGRGLSMGEQPLLPHARTTSRGGVLRVRSAQPMGKFATPIRSGSSMPLSTSSTGVSGGGLHTSSSGGMGFGSTRPGTSPSGLGLSSTSSRLGSSSSGLNTAAIEASLGLSAIRGSSGGSALQPNRTYSIQTSIRSTTSGLGGETSSSSSAGGGLGGNSGTSIGGSGGLIAGGGGGSVIQTTSLSSSSNVRSPVTLAGDLKEVFKALRDPVSKQVSGRTVSYILNEKLRDRFPEARFGRNPTEPESSSTLSEHGDEAIRVCISIGVALESKVLAAMESNNAALSSQQQQQQHRHIPTLREVDENEDMMLALACLTAVEKVWVVIDDPEMASVTDVKHAMLKARMQQAAAIMNAFRKQQMHSNVATFPAAMKKLASPGGAPTGSRGAHSGRASIGGTSSSSSAAGGGSGTAPNTSGLSDAAKRTILINQAKLDQETLQAVCPLTDSSVFGVDAYFCLADNRTREMVSEEPDEETGEEQSLAQLQVGDEAELCVFWNPPSDLQFQNTGDSHSMNNNTQQQQYQEGGVVDEEQHSIYDGDMNDNYHHRNSISPYRNTTKNNRSSTGRDVSSSSSSGDANRRRGGSTGRHSDGGNQQSYQDSNNTTNLTTSSHTYTIPSPQELSQLSPNQLRSVPNFKVVREGVGSIEWLEPIDLVGVDVLKEVNIEPGEVQLFRCYIQQQGVDNKPLPGTKLNRRALITIENARPDDDEEEENPLSLAEYGQILRNHCANQGIRFHSYDGAAARFQFIVPSF